MLNLRIQARLLLAFGVLGCLLLGAVGGGWAGISSMYGSIDTIYADRVVPLRDLKMVSDLYAVSIVDASHKVRDGAVGWTEGSKGVGAARADIAKRWAAFTSTRMNAQETALARDAELLMGRADKAVDQLEGILGRQDRPALATFTAAELYPAIDPLSEALGRLVDLQLDVAKAEREAAERTYAALKAAFSVILMAALAALGLAGRSVVAGVSRPLSRIAGQMQRIAEGDLAASVTDTGKRDEIGTLARALEHFKEALLATKQADEAAAAESEAKGRRARILDGLTTRFDAKVSTLAQGLSAAATEMEATARSMSATADETTSRSANVAGAAEQTSANVQTVAAATEELSISVREIASQVAQSTGIADRAVETARVTDDTMRSLASGAGRIGDVIALINGIAAQTNLLALNATIEAARAGEAGRGFAVVAAEVKALAGQTTKATEDITAQIAGIQSATEGAVAAMGEIGRIIGEMSAISSAVAAAVEEQGAATQEIARSVQEAARGTQQVTGSIEDVKRGAGETGAAAAQVLGAARELAQHSDQLGREVASFLSGVKAA